MHLCTKQLVTNTKIIARLCSSNLDYLTIKYRPIYLPLGLTIVIVTAVYIPPDASASIALGYLLSAINSENRAPTLKHPISQHTIPVYTPFRKKPQHTIKTVETWPEGASSHLQNCFERTNRGIFEVEDLEEYTTVLCYIRNCVDNATVDKSGCPRKEGKRRSKFSSRTVTLPSGLKTFRSDRALYSTATANLKRGIIKAEANYKRKIEDHFTNNNPQQVWQGIQHITNYKTRNHTTVNGDASLAGELNCFFAMR